MSSTLATVNGELTKSMLLHFIGTQLAKFLTKEYIYKDAYYRVTIENIKSTLKPGDVVLVEGHSRASSAIQFNSLLALIGLMQRFLLVKQNLLITV